MAEVNTERLIELIAEMREKQTPESQEAVLEEIVMNARFLIPAEVHMFSEEEKKNNENPEHNARVRFGMLTNDKKETYFPAFTTMDELHKWNPSYEGETMALSFDDYSAMLSKSSELKGMVIDPFNSNLIIDSRMAEDLSLTKSMKLNGSAKRAMRNGEKLQFTLPEVMPDAMINAISEHLKGIDIVNKAYFRLMIRENNAQSYLVAVDFEGEDYEPLFKGIAEAARPHLGNMFIDLVDVTNPLGQKVVECTEPFYVK